MKRLTFNISDGFKNNLFSACLRKFQEMTNKTLLLEVLRAHRPPKGGRNLKDYNLLGGRNLRALLLGSSQ